MSGLLLRLLLLAACLGALGLAWGTWTAAADPPPVLWAPGPVLTQIGPTCTAYALAAFEQAAPHATRGPAPLRLYALSQAADHLPAGYAGAFVGTTLTWLVGHGWVAGWHPTTAPAPALAWLRGQGPILVQGACRDMLAGIPGPVHAACDTPALSHVWLCYGAGPGPGVLACSTTWGPLLGRFAWSEAALTHTLAAGGIVFLASKRRPGAWLGWAW